MGSADGKVWRGDDLDSGFRFIENIQWSDGERLNQWGGEIFGRW